MDVDNSFTRGVLAKFELSLYAISKKKGGLSLFAEISRTQHTGIPGSGRNHQNLRNSGVTAGKSSVINNQGHDDVTPTGFKLKLKMATKNIFETGK